MVEAQESSSREVHSLRQQVAEARKQVLDRDVAVSKVRVFEVGLWRFASC